MTYQDPDQIAERVRTLLNECRLERAAMKDAGRQMSAALSTTEDLLHRLLGGPFSDAFKAELAALHTQCDAARFAWFECDSF